jgi:membrane protease YdiL (CAAX protease family)
VSYPQSSRLARSTPATTWRWLWPDVLVRILPLTGTPLLYGALLHLPLSWLGLVAGNWPLQVVIGLPIGLAMATFAILYRTLILGPRFRRPTCSDHLLQSVYYLCINAPAEEVFFRGLLLTGVAHWTGWVGWGWLVSTAAYTLYHRLGKWNWRSIAGVGLAGILFSSLYIALPGPRSLLLVVIVHGFTTWGFLSLGDEVLYWRWRRTGRRTP